MLRSQLSENESIQEVPTKPMSNTFNLETKPNPRTLTQLSIEKIISPNLYLRARSRQYLSYRNTMNSN